MTAPGTAKSRIEHRLRLADRNDLGHLRDIARTAYPGDATLDLAALQRDDTLYLAELRTAIDGFIVLLPLQDSVLIHRLAVAADARNMGLGGWLLDCAALHAAHLGLAHVEMQRPAEDKRGIAWLTARGFSLLPHGGNKLYLRRPAG